MLNILVACKEQKMPGGLEHLREPHRVLFNTLPDWAMASNALLARAAALGGDALFLDDDVTLTADSLDYVFTHYDRASLFGLDLHDLSGARQSGARHTWDGSTIHDWVQPGPAYVAHVSTSAIYIKQDALGALRFPEWPGVHWEDVAFCFDAWAQGFKVLAVPGYVHHAIAGGIGATKRHDAHFWERWALNRQHFAGWCAEHDLSCVPREAVLL